MNPFLVGALAVCFLASLPNAVASECLDDGYGDVRLTFVLAANGYGLEEGEIESFESAATGKDYAKEFQGNLANNIPYGTYRLRARVSGFWSVDRLVEVQQPSVHVVLGAHIGMCHEINNAALTVTVRGLPDAGPPVWARLSGIRTNSVFDVPVQSGSLSLWRISADDYSLAIWSGERVLYAGSVRVSTPSTQLDIGLARGGVQSPTKPKTE
jgi:hypothetical protein